MPFDRAVKYIRTEDVRHNGIIDRMINRREDTQGDTNRAWLRTVKPGFTVEETWPSIGKVFEDKNGNERLQIISVADVIDDEVLRSPRLYYDGVIARFGDDLFANDRELLSNNRLGNALPEDLPTNIRTGDKDLLDAYRAKFLAEEVEDIKLPRYYYNPKQVYWLIESASRSDADRQYFDILASTAFLPEDIIRIIDDTPNDELPGKLYQQWYTIITYLLPIMAIKFPDNMNLRLASGTKTDYGKIVEVQRYGYYSTTPYAGSNGITPTGLVPGNITPNERTLPDVIKTSRSNRVFFHGLSFDVPLPTKLILQERDTSTREPSYEMHTYIKDAEGIRVVIANPNRSHDNPAIDDGIMIPVDNQSALPVYPRFQEAKLVHSQEPVGTWAELIDEGYSTTAQERISAINTIAEEREELFVHSRTYRLPFRNNMSIEDIIEDNGQRFDIEDISEDLDAGRNKAVIVRCTRVTDGTISSASFNPIAVTQAQ